VLTHGIKQEGEECDYEEEEEVAERGDKKSIVCEPHKFQMAKREGWGRDFAVVSWID
jgi:hypothetical protein